MEYKKIVRSILSNRKLTVANQINQIKLLVSAGEFKEALKLHPLLLKTLNRTPYFKTLNDIYLKEPYSFTNDFKKEFKWVANILESHFEEIDEFLEFKNQFELYLLLDEFGNAVEVVKEVENLFGVSLWSIEANLIIEEKVSGSESNWNLLTKYLNDINSSIYEFTINASSKRIESKLSYESFLNQFQNDIDSINADGIIEDFLVFKNFNIVNYEYKYPDLKSVLYVSNIFSIIDQYLILIDVILYNVSETQNYDKLFGSFIRKATIEIKNDVRLTNIYNVINDKNQIITTKTNEMVFECLNYYYSGNFEFALEKAKVGILTHPTEFEFYQIYCKSLINLDLNFISIDVSETINDILTETYKLLTFKKDDEDSWKNQLKTTLFLMNTNFGKQILGLLAEIESKSNKNYIIGFLSSSYNSQNNIYLNETRNNVINNFKEVVENQCFKVQLYKNGYEVNFSGEVSKSDLQSAMFYAINNFKLKNYSEVIRILNAETYFDQNPYYHERKVYLLFYSFLNLKLLNESLVLFGNVFFDNLIITRKINHIELYNEIKACYKKDDFVNLIEYPILFSLTVKEYDLYEAYDDFISSLNIFSVADIEIETFIEKYSLEKTIYFLNNVVTTDTLKYSTEYHSINDVEEDRIKILNILILFDSTNKLIYENEINEIYRINSVRKVLKEVDEGRLYIDVSSLKEVQNKKFKDDFKRFKEIEISSSFKNLIGFNTSNTKNWEKALTEKNEINEKYNSADYLAFKSIYLESRENFLFSKEYGLDSCLSTRIRHGALKNHIRSVFEKLDLVTSKLKDKYRDNEKWQDQLFNIPETNYGVQVLLKQFSKEIDDYTKFIVEKVIQIETEKTTGKENGVFKFFTNDPILFTYYTQNKLSFDSTESIIEMLLTNLVNHTLIDLQQGIEIVFSKTIPNKFQEIIDITIGDLRKLNLPTDCQLIPNLIKSSTEIQIELENISNWFYLNTTSSSTLLNIETVIDASIELTNKINPNHRINPKITLKCEPFGVYSSLIFVFNILFNNIIQHSRLPTDLIDINIEIESVEEKYFEINISNSINKNIDFSINIDKLNKIKENWNNHDNIDRSNKEGESGFDKIKRILLYETYSKTEKFEFNIVEDKISISLYFPYLKFKQNE